MKYPIGIQSFESLRSAGCIYIDKTAQIYDLTDKYKYVFLGRPRRFGKSLLMSTIQAYFEGRRELFCGLAIENLETEWTCHPVLHFDLNTGDYANNGMAEIHNVLNYQLQKYEKIYGGIDDTLSNRLMNLIECARAKTGQKVVVLIDEYDKPILTTMDAPDVQDSVRSALKSFYGSLKSSDTHIRFAMMTGVSKFGQLSVFSDLNNIKDISMLAEFTEICGITRQEILDYLSEPTLEFARIYGIGEDEMIEILRNKYDGYRFSHIGTKVFNPYSLLNAFSDKQLGDYWFESGTPTFLVKLLRQNGYDLSDIDGIEVKAESLYKDDTVSPIPVLYQSGYLTIKDYNNQRARCKLGYPNQEVESGFLDFLLPYYSNLDAGKSDDEISNLVDDVMAGDVDSFMMRLRSIFYSIPYAQDNSYKVQEGQVRNLTYLIFKLMGLQIHVECPMSRGRSDAVVCTPDNIYIFEFKIDSTARKAIDQIFERRYAEPFASDPRRTVLIGVNYSTAERAIIEWETYSLD